MAEGTAALRAAAAHWSLAGDQQLLNLLQDIHQSIVARCTETTERLDQMAKGLRDASVNLQNVNNKFLALSNTQFVESRVYEDDTDVTAPPVVSKEPPQTNDLTSELSKLKQSLHILESYHEPLHILRDSDSDSDSEEDDDRLVLKPKDLYAERPLPFIIGTPQWKAKWHAGLVAEDSDTDSSASRAEEVDEYSESDDEPVKVDMTPQRKMSTGSSSLQSEAVSVSPVRPSPSDVAAEIARRLGGDVKIPEREPVYNEPETVVRKLYKPQQPTVTIFPDEPPPLEDSSDEDIFAGLHKTNNNTSNNIQKDLFDFNKKNDLEQALFGGKGEHEPVSTESQKPPLFEDEIQPEVKNTPENIIKEENTKKPVGGISLFGTNKHAESIGAAILKRNQRISSTSGEESNTDEVKEVKDVKHKEVKRERDIFDDLFAKSEKLNKINEQKEVKKVAQKEVKEVKKDVKKDLFSDLFDDIDDIFSSDIVVKNTKNEKPLFNDDDDLFAEVSNIKNNQQDKDNIVSKSNLVEDKAKAEKPTDTKNNAIRELKKETKGLFDSDSDDGMFSKEKPKVTKEQKSKPLEHKISDDIFGDDDDDLFSKKKRVKNAKSLSKTVDKSDNALFDSDDELFSSKTDPQKKVNTILQDKANNILNTAEKEPAKTNINTEDIFKSQEKSKALEVIESINNDIFNDGDELFKRTENTKSNDEKLFTDNKSSVKTDLNPEGKTEKANVVENVKDNTIEDNDELFTKPEPIKKPSIKSINEILDDEDGDELFKNKKVESTKIPSIKPIDEILDDEDDELFTNNTKTEPSEDLNKKSINTILDDEDLFSNNKSVNKNEIASETKDAHNIKDHFTEPINDFYKSYEQESNIRTTRIASDVEIPKVNKNKNGIFDDADDYDELFKTPINKTKTNDQNEEKTEPANTVTTDIFSDIFDDVPPLFEKPKESKKSKNVNALFDDDSDDEALFFKKNDVISEEKPEISPSKERFGIFNDEPPAIDIDFTQKSNKTDITEKPQKPEEKFDTSTDSSISDKIENITPKLDKSAIKFSEDITDNTTKEPKKVGKLKPMNFNINVNTLLPGASPKKKVEEDKSSSNEELHETDKIEPPLVKSVSFDDPEILDNKISKERAKIQVKRRPSTRRARKEAVRKSAIDMTDSLDSPEDTVKDVKVKTVYILNDADIFGEVENAKTTETKKHLNIVDSDEELFKKSDDKSQKDILDKNNDIFNDENSQINDEKHETKSFMDESEELFKSSTSLPTSSKSTEENTINKNDIKNVEKVSETKSFLDSDDDEELFKTKTSKPVLTNYSSDEDLFKPKKGIETLGKVYGSKDTKVNTNLEKKPHNIFDDFPPTRKDVTQTEIIKPKDIVKEKPKEIVKEKTVKSILDESSDEDDLFKSKTKLSVKKEGKSLFGDDFVDGDDLFGQKATKEQKQDIPAPQSAKELKPAETVFVDPLSLFGDEE